MSRSADDSAASTPRQPPDPTIEKRPGPQASASRATAANALTLLRLIAAPLCGFLIFESRDLEAVIVFTVAVATYFADGPVARKYGGASAFGALLDHGTDATFVILGTTALVSRGLLPAALPAAIGLAFAQYTLDSRALRGQRLRASSLGRWNGILYFVLLGTPIIRNAVGLSWPSDATLLLLAWLLVASTLVSMADRLLALRRARFGYRRG